MVSGKVSTAGLSTSLMILPSLHSCMCAHAPTAENNGNYGDVSVTDMINCSTCLSTLDRLNKDSLCTLSVCVYIY